MTNREKKAEQILDIACTGDTLAMKKDGNLVGCGTIDCYDCAFFNDNSCNENIVAWANSEYEEPRIIGINENTPVDTKILVSSDGVEWYRRHFAYVENNDVYAWNSGMTSFSIKDADEYDDGDSGYCGVPWKYAKLYTEE